MHSVSRASLVVWEAVTMDNWAELAASEACGKDDGDSVNSLIACEVR